MKILVVYFSRTGNTKRVAERLAAALHADVDVILERRSRLGIVGYLRSAIEATKGRLVDIASAGRAPMSYDLVIVGTPTWNASVASPVRTYLHKYAKQFHDVAFFCTYGGRGGERVIEQMREVACHDARATLILRDNEIDAASGARAIASFVERVAQMSRVAA